MRIFDTLRMCFVIRGVILPKVALKHVLFCNNGANLLCKSCSSFSFDSLDFNAFILLETSKKAKMFSYPLQS